MIYDLSPPIGPALPVWPGDIAPQREIRAAFERGDAFNLSALHTTVHVGAHIDAPCHIVAGKPTIDQLGLEPFIGRALVIRIKARPRQAIEPEQLPPRVVAPRVLLATDTYRAQRPFSTDFAGLSAAAVDHLHALGVLLVGIDTPSVDTFGANGLPAHVRLAEHGMIGLEGLVLSGVPEGEYELVALPLRLSEFEASPVRAILRPLVGK